MTHPDKINADQEFLHAFAAAGECAARRIESNPLLCALSAEVSRVDRATGLVTLHFQPQQQFLQGRGVVQGGIVAAMLDFAMAFSALASVTSGQSVATLSMNVSFLRAVHPGRLTVVGEVERAGRSVAFTRAVLSDASGTPLASATSTLAVLASR